MSLSDDHGFSGCAQERRSKLLEDLTLQANGEWRGLQRAIFDTCGKTWPRELLLLLLRQFVSIWMCVLARPYYCAWSLCRGLTQHWRRSPDTSFVAVGAGPSGRLFKGSALDRQDLAEKLAHALQHGMHPPQETIPKRCSLCTQTSPHLLVSSPGVN